MRESTSEEERSDRFWWGNAPGLGFFSFKTAWNTLQGYEIMNMIRKGQIDGKEKGNIISQITFISFLFGVAA
jgi:hypothetical protein